jgi:hypothetical protein
VATALRGSTAGTLTIGSVQQTVVVRAGAAPEDLAALRALPLVQLLSALGHRPGAPAAGAADITVARDAA